MKVRLPLMVQDPAMKGVALVERFRTETEPFFLDGPVTRRVAVLDFDEETGSLRPGARFLPARDGEDSAYAVDEGEIYARDFNGVSALATVLRTMAMFEEDDTLGRPLVWAFDAPQLLVIPRAGEWTNAFYERESHSLQFFSFLSGRRAGHTVHTSLSHDIVAHECGHAILDGVARDLYNNLTPQSLALHEAVADLTAAVMAFRSRTLREAVLAQTRGSIADSTAFSAVAEEFGAERDPGGEAGHLRSLLNDRRLVADDDAGIEPHALSEVLSGALYAVMVKLHAALRAEHARGDELGASGTALFIGAERFKRLIFRALDYLPPGEVSFADYGRAIIAADQASHPESGRERRWLVEEFRRRGIVADVRELDVATDYDHPALADVSLQALVESDWAAYEFANRNRAFLGVPEGINLRVRPRLDTTKLYYHRDCERKTRECIFRVSWDRHEPNPPCLRLPPERQVTAGVTLAIDWETRRVRALLRSDTGPRGQADRDRLLRRLVETGTLRVGDHARGPDGRWLRSAVRAETMDGLMRVRATAHLLHIMAVV
jgi:hypothetical protein